LYVLNGHKTGAMGTLAYVISFIVTLYSGTNCYFQGAFALTLRLPAFAGCFAMPRGGGFQNSSLSTEDRWLCVAGGDWTRAGGNGGKRRWGGCGNASSSQESPRAGVVVTCAQGHDPALGLLEFEI